MKAINLMKVTQELALTLIDDSADAHKDFTQEEYGLMDSIKANLQIFTQSLSEIKVPSGVGSSLLID